MRTIARMLNEPVVRTIHVRRSKKVQKRLLRLAGAALETPVPAIAPPPVSTALVKPKTNRRADFYCKQSGVCFYCRHHVAFEKWTIDHRIALASGGTNKKDNLVGACASCNQAKGVMSEESFLRSNYLKQKKQFLSKKVQTDVWTTE